MYYFTWIAGGYVPKPGVSREALYWHNRKVKHAVNNVHVPIYQLFPGPWNGIFGGQAASGWHWNRLLDKFWSGLWRQVGPGTAL